MYVVLLHAQEVLVGLHIAKLRRDASKEDDVTVLSRVGSGDIAQGYASCGVVSLAVAEMGVVFLLCFFVGWVTDTSVVAVATFWLVGHHNAPDAPN